MGQRDWPASPYVELGKCRKLGLRVGEELLEVDRDCLNLVRLDKLRIKVQV